MKLYATTTSERASKGQGGNKQLDIVIKIGDRSVPKFSILVDTDGVNTYRLRLHDYRNNTVAFNTYGLIEETKGNKQKGELCKHYFKSFEGTCSKCGILRSMV